MHGTCFRKLRTDDGTKLYRLRVMECRECGKTHRELPENIVPYKRNDISRISAIAQATCENHLSAAETSTWKRIVIWCKWFLDYARCIIDSLNEQNHQRSVGEPSGGFETRLSYLVRLVVNSGNWIQHRSVQT